MDIQLPQRAIEKARLAHEVARSGFAFLPSWEPEATAEEIAASLGVALTLNTAPAIHHLSPKRGARPNTYSGIFGLEAFPFHTDMAHWRAPPRFLMLRCAKGYVSVTTDLIDGSDIVERLGRSIMSRALVKPRRPLNGQTPLFSLYRPATPGRNSMLRWDEVFIVPASAAGERGFTQMKEQISKAPRARIALQSKGDTLCIDNWRMLHGRSAVDVDQTDRAIQRAYLGELY